MTIDLLKFWPLIVALFAIAVAWGAMRNSVSSLEKADEINHRAVMAAFARLEGQVQKDLAMAKELQAQCRAEHDVCRFAVNKHLHESPASHVTEEERKLTSEWRIDVIERLGSIEAMLRDLHRNNGK